MLDISCRTSQGLWTYARERPPAGECSTDVFTEPRGKHRIIVGTAECLKGQEKNRRAVKHIYLMSATGTEAFLMCESVQKQKR
jgi:hypothetical protein